MCFSDILTESQTVMQPLHRSPWTQRREAVEKSSANKVYSPLIGPKSKCRIMVVSDLPCFL